MSDIRAINYQSLETNNKSVQIIVRRNLPLVIGSAVLIVGLLFVMPQLSLLAFVGPMLYLAAQEYRLRNKVWQEFAAANSWPFDTTLMPDELISPGVQFGRRHQYSPIIDARLGGVAAKLFLYTTVVGSGRSQRRYSFTVAQVQLPKALPHILLRSKKDQESPLLKAAFADHETLQLEGDFDKYFTLQVEKGQEVDALAVIAPDVMQTLITYSQAESIEIAGDRLYFIIGGDERDPASIKQLITSVVELNRQILEYARATKLPEAFAKTASPKLAATGPAKA